MAYLEIVIHICYANGHHGLISCSQVSFSWYCVDTLNHWLYCLGTPLVKSVIWAVRAYISFRFQVFLVFVYILPCRSVMSPGWPAYAGGRRFVYQRPFTPSVSRTCICKCGAPNQCSSEDMSEVVPCWYHGWTERSLRLWPLLATSRTYLCRSRNSCVCEEGIIV